MSVEELKEANGIARFLAKIQIAEYGCWEWQGSVNQEGYGWFWVNGVAIKPHRYSYELLKGVIPPGLQIDHLCRNRRCVNPEHLEPVTGRENVMRGTGPTLLRQRMLSITHCPQGHPYDEENTYIIPTGGRRCRKCWYQSTNLSHKRTRFKKRMETQNARRS